MSVCETNCVRVCVCHDYKFNPFVSNANGPERVNLLRTLMYVHVDICCNGEDEWRHVGDDPQQSREQAEREDDQVHDIPGNIRK